jgi:hypothetical protein
MVLGQFGYLALVLVSYWTTVVLGKRAIWLLDYLVAGLLGYFLLVFSAVGLFGCWAIGQMCQLAVSRASVLLGNSDFRLFVCRVIRFRAIWLFEYKAAWLFGYWVTKLLVCWPVGLLGCCFPVGHARQLKRSSFVLFGIKYTHCKSLLN